MAMNEKIRCPKTMVELARLTADVIEQGLKFTLWHDDPQFEFWHVAHTSVREGVYYTDTDHYLIVAGASVRFEGQPADGSRRLDLRMEVVRHEVDYLPDGGVYWDIRAWHRGVYRTEKPSKAAFRLWRNPRKLELARLRNQPNFPPAGKLAFTMKTRAA